MNCAKCRRVLYFGQKVCECGEKVPIAKPVKIEPGRIYPPNAQDKAFAQRLREVNAYVSDYRLKNPGATKKTACMQYLQERGIKLPDYVAAQKESDEERTAIQQE